MTSKEKILSTAFKLFVNHGYHNTSMRQLVEASGMSKGAFYHYFKSKSELYDQVISQYFLSFYKEVDWKKYEEINLSVKEIEHEMQQFYLNFVPQIVALTEKGISEYYIMYFEAFNLLPEFKREVQKFYKNLEQLFLNARDNKEQPLQTATKIVAKYEGLLFMMAIDPQLSIEDLIARVSV